MENKGGNGELKKQGEKAFLFSRFRKIGMIGKLILLAVIIGLGFLGSKVLGKDDGKMEIITVSELQEIFDTSELHTFQAVYNGIAEVKNEKNSEKIDYYVSYNAKVNAGFDFNKLEINTNEKEKIVELQIPEITIQDVIVDIGSLDYIFLNDKVNKSGISDGAYDACIADVTIESSKEDSIYIFARVNAENTMKAITTPFLKDDYELKVVFGGAE